jgi:hypothetical protein
VSERVGPGKPERLMSRVMGACGLGPPPPRRWLVQQRPENCAQTVVAMLAGREPEEIERMVGHTGALTVADTLSVLSRLGYGCRPISASLVLQFWPSLLERAGGRKLRGLGFRRPTRGEKYGHAYLLFGRRLYDPADGSFVRLDAAAVKSLDWLALLPDAR